MCFECGRFGNDSTRTRKRDRCEKHLKGVKNIQKGAKRLKSLPTYALRMYVCMTQLFCSEKNS